VHECDVADAPNRRFSHINPKQVSKSKFFLSCSHLSLSLSLFKKLFAHLRIQAFADSKKERYRGFTFRDDALSEASSEARVFDLLFVFLITSNLSLFF